MNEKVLTYQAVDFSTSQHVNVSTGLVNVSTYQHVKILASESVSVSLCQSLNVSTSELVTVLTPQCANVPTFQQVTISTS